jgi:uncharacterized cupin superfamily protein
VPETPLTDTPGGLEPEGDGWYVVNVRDACWWRNDAFGAATTFEADDRPFAQFGINIQVLEPGTPKGMYHRESNQEDFLVLSGECMAIIEGEERRLRAWDFVHCPAGTEHIFVGAGDTPCLIFMAGGRTGTKEIVYPRSELALQHGAGVETETSVPAEAYAPFPRWVSGRPESFDGLPWG